MTLAMDIDDYIEKEKVNWSAESKAEGIEEGVVKGKAEGKAEERRDIALRMLQDGLSVEQVARVTGLSVEEVQHLRCEQ